MKTQETKCFPLRHENDLHEDIRRFQDVETLQKKRTLTREEQACEEWFKTITKPEKDGKFDVSIPLKGNVTETGESKKEALHSSLSLEKRFEKMPQFKKQYRLLIQD